MVPGMLCSGTALWLKMHSHFGVWSSGETNVSDASGPSKVFYASLFAKLETILVKNSKGKDKALFEASCGFKLPVTTDVLKYHFSFGQDTDNNAPIVAKIEGMYMCIGFIMAHCLMVSGLTSEGMPLRSPSILNSAYSGISQSQSLLYQNCLPLIY